MNSIATGRTPALMMSDTQAPATSLTVKAHQDRPRAFGLAQDPQRRLGHDAKLPFRAADEAEQVQPAGIEMRAADLGHGAVHQDQRDAEQVVRGHAVFQAMRPARIHRDIARDGAGKLRRRIGGVEEILLLDRAGHGQVRAPGLDPDVAVLVVGLDHLVHPRDAQDHAIRRRQRAAGKRRARPARHDRHAHVMADLQHGRDLFGRTGQDHGQRRAAIGGQRVAFIGAGFGNVGNHAAVGQDPRAARQRSAPCGRSRRHSELAFPWRSPL